MFVPVEGECFVNIQAKVPGTVHAPNLDLSQRRKWSERYSHPARLSQSGGRMDIVNEKVQRSKILNY